MKRLRMLSLVLALGFCIAPVYAGPKKTPQEAANEKKAQELYEKGKTYYDVRLSSTLGS